MNLEQHLLLLENSSRGLNLEAAIQKAVLPGSAVLDAGCGTGFLSMLAARAGAARVTGVDRTRLAVARELARRNGLTDRIGFVDGDLGEIVDSGELPQFDVILGMVYYNDPRRDEHQSQVMHRLVHRLLKPGGRCIPGWVRYMWRIADWPTQSWVNIERALRKRTGRLSNDYGFDFGPLEEAILQEPQRSWFPRRLPDGKLVSEGAKPLGDPVEAFTVDYGTAETQYPEALEYTMSRGGTATTIIWTQELLYEDVVIFSNESVTWLSPALPCSSGSTVRVLLDHRWRSTNVAAAALAEEP